MFDLCVFRLRVFAHVSTLFSWGTLLDWVNVSVRNHTNMNRKFKNEVRERKYFFKVNSQSVHDNNSDNTSCCLRTDHHDSSVHHCVVCSMDHETLQDTVYCCHVVGEDPLGSRDQSETVDCNTVTFQDDDTHF